MFRSQGDDLEPFDLEIDVPLMKTQRTQIKTRNIIWQNGKIF